MGRLQVCLLFAILVHSGAGTSKVGEWITYGDKKYIIFERTVDSMLEAQTLCMNHGGILPEPRNHEESLFLSGMGTEQETGTANTHKIYLGMRDQEIEGQWKWESDGSNVEWFDWIWKPYPRTDINCAVIARHDWTWLDNRNWRPERWVSMFCDRQVYNVICEKDVPWTVNPNTGISYKVFNDQLSWSDAKQLCEDHDAELIQPRNQEENDYLIKLSPGKTVWLGITDKRREGRWEYLNGDPVTWTTVRANSGDFGHTYLPNHTWGDYSDKKNQWVRATACQRG